MNIEQIMDIRYSEDLRRHILNFVDSESHFRSREKELLIQALRFRNLMLDVLGEKAIQEAFRLNKAKVIRCIESASAIIVVMSIQTLPSRPCKMVKW